MQAFLVLGLLAAPPQLEAVNDMAAFRRVCDAVRSEASVRFDGDEVERGKARADFKRRRDQMLSGVYTSEVPASGFAFSEYDYDSRRLPLDGARPLRPADGADLLPIRGDEELDFTLPPESAQKIVKARAAGKLRLRVTFRLASGSDMPDPCVRLGGGRTLRIRIDPLAYELAGEGGARLARVESPRYHDAVAELMPVSRPRVQVAKTSDLSDSGLIHSIESDLLPCYKSGLTKNARLRGSLVLGVGVDREGRVESARPEIDAIGDESLVSCAVDHIKQQRFPKGKQHLSVPVFFKESE